MTQTPSELHKKVMLMEYKLQQYMQRDAYIGPGNPKTLKSRAYILWEECNALWKVIEAQGRHQIAFGTPGTTDDKGSQKSLTINPYS